MTATHVIFAAALAALGGMLTLFALIGAATERVYDRGTDIKVEEHAEID